MVSGYWALYIVQDLPGESESDSDGGDSGQSLGCQSVGCQLGI
jgi:hypothetical protein